MNNDIKPTSRQMAEKLINRINTECLSDANQESSVAELASLLKDRERLDWLRNTLGDTRQASDQDVSLFQDDATHDYFVVVNPRTAPRHYFGGSLRTAIDAATGKEPS